MKNTGKLIALSMILALAWTACEKKSDDGSTTPLIEWTWIGGSETADQAGAYGTQGTPDSTNVPGAREDAAAWTGDDGAFWLFGGYGYDSTAYPGRLNDLWKFDPSASTWTWIAGSALRDGEGFYGGLGVPGPTNVPGARNGAVCWADASGRLWLFGGLGFDAAGAIGQINDLWRFDPATSEWTWVSGSSVRNQPGVYGELGIADPSNVPGARVGATAGTDADGNLWLFGGYGYDGSAAKGRLNDLWKFDPATVQWTWVSGSDASEEGGTYGTKGTADPANVPGARSQAASWVGADGLFWVFGGNGRVDEDMEGRLNDLWTYDPETSEWTWVAGSSAPEITGTYGTMGTASSGNIPGSRYGSTCWRDSDGAFWLFGGYAIDIAASEGWLNDLWKLDPASLEWTWVGGNSYRGQAGAYGTKGTAATSNHPGARYMPVSWIDAQDRHWIFGGYGLDSEAAGGRLNDLWR
jgi:N-acetylneuraminic acid mutarotase